MRLLKVTVFFVFAWVIPTLGFTASETDLINGDFDATSRKVRVEIAGSLLKRIDKLAQYLQTPSPSETRWLQDEQEKIAKLAGKSHDARLVKLVESPEFQSKKLYTILNNASSALKCIQTPKVELQREMLCWSVASLNLTDTTHINEAIRILRNKEKLPKDISKLADLSGESVGNGAFYNWFGRGIHEYIVIPYLAQHIN